MSDEPDITITIEFGDVDPEDAYCAEDPEEDRLDVLEAVIEHLREHRDERFEARRLEALRAIEEDFTGKSTGTGKRARSASRRIDEIRGALEEMG